MSLPIAEIPVVEVSYLFNEVFKYSIQYHPNTSVLHNISNSDNLNKITNLQLRNALVSWETDYQRMQTQEKLIQGIRFKIIDLLKTNGNFGFWP